MMVTRRALLTIPAAACAAVAFGGDSDDHAAGSVAAPLKLERLAWAGVRLESAGVTLFIDAIAPDPAAGQPGPKLAGGPGRAFALITHHHNDHWDPHALASVLGENGYVVCSQETTPFVPTRLVSVEPTRVYEPVFLTRAGGEFAAFAVPAVDGLGSPQVSWVVDAGGKRLIHCGDTLWHGHWWDISRAYGPFDVALLPINGFRNPQGRFVDEGVPMGMTPEEAAAAAHALRARVAVPIHYGSHGDSSYLEAVDVLQRFKAAALAKGVAVDALSPGDELRLA
jgi:L-ascorbate metabolism protein UlaG (beta-lactamase superfamily)